MFKNFQRRKIIYACSYAPRQDLLYDRFKDTCCVAFENGYGVYDGITGAKESVCQIPYTNPKFIYTINMSNIVVIVPKADLTLYIWDRHKNTFLSMIPLQERMRITALRFRPDYICVITANSVVAVNLYDQSIISSIATASNAYGAFDMVDKFSENLAVILGNEVGCFTFHSYDNPDKKYPIINAFPKDITVLKMSPNGNLVAVASFGCNRIRFFTVPDGEESMSLSLPMSENGAVFIEFDKYDSSLFVVTPANNLYIFDLHGIDINSKVDPSVSLHYETYYYLPEHEYFWAYYGSMMNTIILVSQSAYHYRLKYNRKKKTLELAEKTKLDLAHEFR
ncbi:WD repeat domain phosphoinositide-interacting protein 3 [Tritrichomonas musculus]|uniref:WD repeat domain phosphoinositide-interacting protein 3 n=1 Tax=Tritrichomonas musculus TaxID=1915356 RepID=A0ABR2IC57_9EUKA